MKKTLLLCLAALALSASAGAQVFNHLALGIGAGTDGLSFELAAPLGRHVDLRAGYGTALGLIGYTASGISVPEHPGNPSGASVATRRASEMAPGTLPAARASVITSAASRNVRASRPQ